MVARGFAIASPLENFACGRLTFPLSHPIINATRPVRLLADGAALLSAGQV
jgi:hypothetical protein